jgi:hypothetical protein
MLRWLSCSLLLGTLLATTGPTQARASSGSAVISQVYGGGGNAGAPFRNDFVELYNRGAATVSLDGWSIQYASASGTALFASNPVVPLSGPLHPGQHYLVQLAGGATGAPLPPPDAIGTIQMAAGAGKVILASTAVGLPCNGGSSPCAPTDLAHIVDLVGYGAASFFEGSGPAPALGNATAARRAGDGAVDTDDNARDFSVAAPEPRNTSVGVGDLEDVGDARIWIGLVNSDAVGLRLDLLVEVLAGDTVVGRGQLDGAAAGSSGFRNARLHTVPLALDAGPLDATGPLSARVSVRRTCRPGGGHASGGVRLWVGWREVDGAAEDEAHIASRFEATIDGIAASYFLRPDGTLGTEAGAPRRRVDVTVDSRSACPQRPFKPFGTWTTTVP